MHYDISVNFILKKKITPLYPFITKTELQLKYEFQLRILDN